MLHRRAAERADGTGWQYVIGKHGGGHPIGYCRDHEPHPTEAEARECYGRYLRDSIRLNAGSCSWGGCTAKDCPNPTQAYASWGDDGYGMTPLCPEHMTVEGVIAAEQLEGPAGDSWIS